ncbi:ATP-binding cassette domain-containing protein [Acuticoccus kandeliae]|uniref:ATP-binding cassette domain-containing protein n=1 Tax=Acuticoccus kandeliae TaxID=2073160 RepID=UPI000D3E3652|nr:ATP-binding cassette domain-containing protein [Acuticoccus kandeliae]
MSFLADFLGGEHSLDAILEAKWKDPAASVARALGVSDARRVVDASDRFPLVGRGQCWLVLSGALDLLWSDQRGRTFIARVEAGGLADAMTETDSDGAVIAIPTEDTELATTTRADLAAHAATPEGREAVQHLFRGWVDLMKATGLTGAPSAGAAPATAPPASGAQQGEATPSPPHADPAAPATAAEAHADWQAPLDHINALVVEGARQGLSARRAARRTRSETVSAETRQRFGARLRQTAALIDRRDHSLDNLGADFNAIARIVYRATGGAGEPVDVMVSPGASERSLIQRYARNNGMMSRTVTLLDDWWRIDHGPLLGFRGAEREPVALIPRPGGYDLVGAEGRIRVTGAVAKTIDRVVHLFQVPLPAETLTPWRLLRYSLFGAGRDVRNIIISMIMLGGFSLVTPIALGWLLDPIVPSAEIHQVAVIGALLLLTAGATAMTGLVQSLSLLRIEGQMENRVQGAVWIRLLSLPAPFFRDFTAGDLANRTDSIDSMRGILGNASHLVLTSIVGALFSLGLMVYFDWEASLIAFLIAALFSIVAVLLGRSILAYNRRTLDLGGKVQGVVLQMVGAIGKLRVAGAEQRAFLRWLEDYRDLVALSLRQRVLNNRLLVLRSVFPYLVTVAVLATIGLQMKTLFAFFDSAPPSVVPPSPMSTAQFVAFNVALGQFTAAMFSATRAILHFSMLHPLFKRVRPILDAAPEPQSRFGHLGEVHGEIELRNVGFRYAPGAPLALKDVSFRAEAGKMTAIVGPSGAGKSSVVRLLLGFETPETGSVFVDGNDIRFVNRWDLRQAFGVVLQDGGLLSGSIYDNVAAGLPVSPEEVTEALTQAGLAEELKSWPMGLNTQVGTGTSVISRGQSQRLMIARAIVRKPKVLIMDEGTSALDNVTQALVTKNLKTMKATQIVIAHRLSTIIDADKIVVLDEGEVVEEGDYKALMARNGLFARLVERQVQ